MNASARRLRVVAGKPGLDGHDRGIKVITQALRDAGMEVVYLGMRLAVEQIADAAVDEDADVVAINFAAADHLILGPALAAALRERGCREDVLLLAGGIIPDEDIPAMKRAGFREVFLPGSPIARIVEYIENNAGRRAAHP